MDKRDFKSLMTTLITPMNAEGALHEELLRVVFEFNVEAGVHGLWVADGTGESILLSDGENRRIAEIVSDQNRGRVKNIVHFGTPTTEHVMRPLSV